MSSRFFGSESESSESESEEEIENPIAQNFLAHSDDEEDVKRVVRSAKEKRFEELSNQAKKLKNFKKNKDLHSLCNTYSDLEKAFIKARPVIEKEENGQPPRFFIRCIAELQDYIQELSEDKDSIKKLNKLHAKGFNVTKRNLKKFSEQFSEQLAAFRENPDADDSDIEEAEPVEVASASDSDSDSSEDAGGFTASSFKKETSVVSSETRSDRILDDGDDDDMDSESDWGSDSESSSSDSDAGGTGLLLREKFLKKVPTKEDEEKKRRKKEEKLERKKDIKAKEGDEAWTEVKKGPSLPSERPKMFSKDDEVSIKTVTAKLVDILASRGRRGTDRKEQIEMVHELMGVAKENQLGVPLYIKIQHSLIMSIFDYTLSGSDAMKPDLWDKSVRKIDEFINMLLSCDQVQMHDQITDEEESLETAPYKIHGDAMTIVERMDSEFTKLVKASDAHSNDYILKLRNETKVCRLIDNMIKFQEKQGHVPDICRIYLRKIEHLYYKYEVKAAEAVKAGDPDDKSLSIYTMNSLCSYIYQRDGTDRLRTRAVLCQIYHMALHDLWYRARNLMLMTHLQETIQHSDLPTQILYNRTMVQLGLCAFCAGQIPEAHNALVDIQSGGRAKELLAQGLLPLRQYERTPEQEKMEKNRQIPFHMHINLEKLECVYLVSAMLQEIPYMAAHEFDARRRMISKSFHHQLKNSERQSLVGPPESMREHVVAASKAMRNGDWRTCRNLLLNEKMNGKVWDLFHNADEVRAMLERKVQEESLRTYLFTHSPVYDSISLRVLSTMFELPHDTTHAIISKMIINEEVMGSLDEPTQCLVMHKTEPSPLQSLSLQCADKLHNIVENNDRTFEQKPYYQRNNMGGQSRGGGYRGGGGDRRWGGQRGDGNKDDRGGGGRRDFNENRRGGGGGGGGGRYGGNRGGDNKSFMDRF